MTNPSSFGQETSSLHPLSQDQSTLPVSNINPYDETSPIILAAMQGDFNRVHQLLMAGADVNEKTKLGDSLFLLAVKKSWRKVFEWGLQYGDINIQDEYGYTGLMWACTIEDRYSFQRLMDKKADVNIQTKKGVTALLLVVSFGDLYMVDALIRAGAQINHQDCIGMSGLMEAVNANQEEILQFLLENGADVSLKNTDGKTALDLAQEIGYTALASRLLAYQEKNQLTSLTSTNGNREAMEPSKLTLRL